MATRFAGFGFPVFMPSDRAKIDYAKEVFRRKYSGDPVMVGPLVVAKYYRIARYVTGDDFKNVGVDCNRTGQVFKATGTAPTNWTNLSTLIEVNIAALKQLALDVYQSATDDVTIKSLAFEGGSGSGDITFEPVLIGIAVNEMLADWDPFYDAPASIPRREIGTTVRLGC